MNVDFLSKTFITNYIADNSDWDYCNTQASADSKLHGGTGNIAKFFTLNGRSYCKFGKHTIQTIVGNVYKTNEIKTGKTVYVLQLGLAKQHPEDLEHDELVAIEIAAEHALEYPIATLIFERQPTEELFNKIAYGYFKFGLNQEFVMTEDEKEAMNQNQTF